MSLHHRRPDGWYIWLACQYVELPLAAGYAEEHHARGAILGRNNPHALTDLLRAMRAERPVEREYGLPQYWTLIHYVNNRHAGFHIIDIPPHVIDALDVREWDGYPRSSHEAPTTTAPALPVPLLPGQEDGGPAPARADQSGG